MKSQKKKYAPTNISLHDGLIPFTRDGQPITMLTVKNSECRWMYGDGADAPMCARPVIAEGFSYCTAHAAKCRAPTRRTSDHWGWR